MGYATAFQHYGHMTKKISDKHAAQEKENIYDITSSTKQKVAKSTPSSHCELQQPRYLDLNTCT